MLKLFLRINVKKIDTVISCFDNHLWNVGIQKSINSFLNKYNEINDPDITSDMVSMKKLEGKDEPSIVDISNEKLGIWIQRKNMFGNKMAVAILNNSDNVTNDDIKEQFQKYSKVFDDSLNNTLSLRKMLLIDH